MVSASEFEHGTQAASVLEQWLPMDFNLTKGLNLFSSTEASLSLTGLVDGVALAGCSKHGCCSRNGVFFLL